MTRQVSITNLLNQVSSAPPARPAPWPRSAPTRHHARTLAPLSPGLLALLPQGPEHTAAVARLSRLTLLPAPAVVTLYAAACAHLAQAYDRDRGVIHAAEAAFMLAVSVLIDEEHAAPAAAPGA